MMDERKFMSYLIFNKQPDSEPNKKYVKLWPPTKKGHHLSTS